jgi:hypothetical protein
MKTQPTARAESVSDPTDTQRYCLRRLAEIDEIWAGIGKAGIVVLNRRFGRGATTEALQAMYEEVKEQGLKAGNPYALLWAVAERRAETWP